MKKLNNITNGKREGWHFEAHFNKSGSECVSGIGVFYESGVGTKIETALGVDDFNDVKHAMYVLGINSEVAYDRDDSNVIYIFPNCTLDTEFLKRIMPYAHFTWKDTEPRKYTFVDKL